MSIERDIKDYLIDIQDSIRDIKNFVAGMDFIHFSSDRKTVNAVIRSLEIIGEAAKKIPDNMRAENPEIPWKEIAISPAQRANPKTIIRGLTPSLGIFPLLLPCCPTGRAKPDPGMIRSQITTIRKA